MPRRVVLVKYRGRNAAGKQSWRSAPHHRDGSDNVTAAGMSAAREPDIFRVASIMLRWHGREAGRPLLHQNATKYGAP